MPTRLSLNGSDWQFKDFYGEDWRWRDSHKPVTRDTRHWRTGSVPGSVHHDLWVAGAIPDPYFEQNSLLIEWIPDRTWLYKKSFAVPANLEDHRATLCFEGVDYEAEFFLNGESLGTHVGMYTPVEFDVTDRLHYGADNLVAVVIEPAPHEQPQVGRTSRVRTHKSRMTYWWDFCPRMVHVGIWDDVYLDFTGPARLTDVFVRPQLNADYSRADLALNITIHSTIATAAEVVAVIRSDGEVVAQTRASRALTPGQSTLDLALTVDQPRLWWPNGYGDQPLYDAEITVYAGDRMSDQRVTSFGIRRLEWVANDGANRKQRPDALPYTLVVNGRKIYITGWNWVPIDVLYGVPRPDKLAHLFALARQANVNLLRVWGGGLIETDAFYTLADELGILVWQEFIQSSSGIDNVPPDDPAYIAMMVREAEQIIPRRRNHPSLALWCGGNELTAADNTPADSTYPLLAALRAAVARLDPDRAWLLTSPSGPVFSNDLATLAADPAALHDVHSPWEYQGVRKQYELYNAGASLLHSEFGVEGLTNRRSLDATVAPEHQSPVTLDNPVWNHLGAWWVKRPVWNATFGELDDVETLRRATQMMQAEGLRYAVEADRRRQFHNSGTLPWQFNEPYPMAACTSTVDYYGQPKPAYYAVARAYEPVHVSARYATVAWSNDRAAFEAQLWINNARLTAVAGQLRARVVSLNGRVHFDQTLAVTVGPNQAAALHDIALPLDSITDPIFLLDLSLDSSAGTPLSRNRYVFTRAANLAPLLAAPRAGLTATRATQGDDWTVTLTNTGSHAALYVWLEDPRPVRSPGFPYFAANHLCLLPGETRAVAVRWHGVPPSDRALIVEGWNTPRLYA